MTDAIRPIQVLHLSITPRGGWHGHAVALIDHLADRSAEHHVLAHWPGAMTPRTGAGTIELRCDWLGQRAIGGLVTLRQIAALARDHEFHWVQVHGLPSEPVGLGFALCVKLAMRRSGAAIAVTPHNAFGRRGPFELRRMRRFTLRLFDRVFVFSDDDRAWAGTRAVRAPFVLPSAGGGIPSRPSPRRSTVGPTIACLPGQIRADKGFHLVPAALAGQDYAIRIVGPDQGGFAKLESSARDHGVPLLGRPGFTDEEAFQAAIAESDVVVLPYRRVTQSGVLAYARAAGTPVAGSMALKDAGLAADAYFEVDDRRSLLTAIERATERGRSAEGPDRDQTGEAIRAAPGLYEPRDRLSDLVADLRDGSGVFVVGSPRAGTTIAARWLAERLGVELGPETHYFTLVQPALIDCTSRHEADRRLRRSGPYLDAAEDVAADVVDTWWNNGSPLPLDRYLVDRGSPWVEKTPAHLRHWPELLRFDRRCRILVVTRSVPATLVSQTDVPWLGQRNPRSLLARILADRIHLGLLLLVAPRRVRVLRYEDFVSMAQTLGDGPSASASMAHETWKALSDQRHVIDDRNRAARQRKPAIWRLGASPVTVAAAIPGAVARVSIDLARSLSAGRSHRAVGGARAMRSTSLAGLSAPLTAADGRLALTFLAFATGRSGRFQIVFLLLVLVSLLYLVRHDFTPSTYRKVVVANPFFALFSAWWCVAVVWSNDLQAGAFDATIFIAGWLAIGLCRRRLAIDTILWSVVAVASAMAIIGLALFVAEVQFARSPSGDLAGLVGSKNHASFLSAMGLVALFGLWRRAEASSGVAIVWAVPLAATAWLGNSEAAIAVVTIGLLVQLWLAADGRYRLARRSLILAATAILAVGLVPIVGESTGESDSDGLAGRRPLWTAVWQEASERPIHGWGPGVWRSPELRPAKTVVAAARAEFGVRGVTYAHSTYLDVLLQTGWTGLVLFVAAMGQLLSRLRRHEEMAALVVGSLVAGIVATRFPNDLTTPILLFAIHLTSTTTTEWPRPPVKTEEAVPVAVGG